MTINSSPKSQHTGVKRPHPYKVSYIPFRRGKIPTNAHPVVQALFREMNDQQISQEEMARRSGVSRNTFKDWKYRSIPRLDMVEACLNVLGLELNVRERDQ